MNDTTTQVLDFEKNIVETEEKIQHLKLLAKDEDIDVTREIRRLERQLGRDLNRAYMNLSAWQKAQIARHPLRPHCLDYIRAFIENFTPLAGDRCFAEDEAMVCGLGKLGDFSVVVIGQEKGNDIDSRIKHNFGMAKPEGYRKAQRMMDLADKFHLPIICFVDTAGAYPGVDAEARGQAEAIASSIEKSLQIKTPMVSVIIGEGGSGGAIAIATANRVLMLEYSIYSVISPEGCASILWRSGDKAQEATEALHLTAQDLKSLVIIDEVIKEPLVAAHRNAEQVFASVKEALIRQLKELETMSGEDLKKQRTEKFLKMGRNLTVEF
ncbi:MAG: acetyl-CoA carboxylase carboxyltransferase subunit alpha [Alphaproteobacteria bacterium]|nr:acetyl-CoA carboxylase carboxyltransferase subunit alpha [Alphaproteobacteria bacterium]